MAVVQGDVSVPVPQRQSRLWRHVRRHPTIVIGGVLLTLMLAMAVFAPWLGTVDP